MSNPQRKALVQMKSNKGKAIYPFKRGYEFVVLAEKNAMQRIEEQLAKVKLTENDPTLKFTNKIQKILCRLRKEKKFTDKEYFEIYPSDPIPPRLYGTIKAHKPEKNCPMRTIMSTLGTPAYRITKYLVEIIQATLNKSNNKIQNSTSFVHEAKGWKIEPTETQVSHDVVNIYPSVLLDRSIQVTVEFLQDDHAELIKRTKLNLTDIQQLLEFEHEKNITNTGNNSYDFKIFRKASITNVLIKPNSKIATHIAVRVFKGFLSRAYKICIEKHLQSKIEFLIDIFTENRHNRNTPTNIATEYLQNINKPKIIDQKKHQEH